MSSSSYAYELLRNSILNLCIGIGAWQAVFEVMGYLAIITNSALIGLYAYKADLLPNTSNITLVLLVVGLEVCKLLNF